MADDNATMLVNQKYDELMTQQIAINGQLQPPRVLVQNVLQALQAWGQTVNIQLGAVSGSHLEHLVGLTWVRQLTHLCNKKLHELIAHHMSPTDRNMAPKSAQDAVRISLDQLKDWARSQGYPVEGIGVKNDEEFQQLVAKVQELAERYRTEQEKGAIALGQGVYADVLEDEDFNDRMRKAGLAT